MRGQEDSQVTSIFKERIGKDKASLGMRPRGSEVSSTRTGEERRQGA